MDPLKTKSLPPSQPSAMKRIIGVFSILASILSLPVLGFAIWLCIIQDYECEQLLRITHVHYGIAAAHFLIFLFGNAVVFLKHHRVLLPGHFLLTIPLLVMLLIGMAFLGAYQMETRDYPGTPLWLRNKIRQPEVWNEIRTCIYDQHWCDVLVYKSVQLTSEEFNMKKLSVIEAGCCKPPGMCGMEYVNATYWNKAEKRDGLGAMHDVFGDCHAWSNDVSQLCYRCNSCQEAFCSKIQGRWKKIGVALIVMPVLLMAVHIMRFCFLMVEKHRG